MVTGSHWDEEGGRTFMSAEARNGPGLQQSRCVIWVDRKLFSWNELAEVEGRLVLLHYQILPNLYDFQYKLLRKN